MVVGNSRQDHCFPLERPPLSAHVDKEQRPRQRANSFAAGVVPTTWRMCLHTFKLLYHMPYTIIGLTHLIYTSYLWIHICIYICWERTGGQGMLQCYQPFPSHSVPTWEVGGQVMSRKTSVSPISGGCAMIFCKTGNKQSHLHCSVEWMRSVKLPALSCASPLPSPLLRIYFVRKICANVRNQGWAMDGKRWGQGPGLHCKRCRFKSEGFVAPG